MKLLIYIINDMIIKSLMNIDINDDKKRRIRINLK